MSFPPEDYDSLRVLLEESVEDRLPVVLTLQIGRLFCSISLLETTTYGLLVSALAREKNFREVLLTLERSTFGQLVSKIEKTGVSNKGTNYLKSIRDLRNHVVHGLFREIPFPGDPKLDEQRVSAIVSRLEKYQAHFGFAERNLWRLMVRAGVFEFVDLGESGYVLYPTDID